MISTMTPMPAPADWTTAAFPAATAAPQAAVIAAARFRPQDTSALVPFVGVPADVRATGLTVGGTGAQLAGLAVLGTAGNAPVQGPPSRGTPV